MARITALIRVTPLGGTVGTFKPIHRDHIAGLDELTITWQRDENGTVTRGVTSDITITGSTFKVIDGAAATDTVEIKFYDTYFKKYYPTFLAQPNTRAFCLDDKCKMTLNIVEQRTEKDCFDNTVIWDNHQNWFDNSGTKKHARIGYCNFPNINFLAGIIYVLLLLMAMVTIFLAATLTLFGITGLQDFLSSLINSAKGCDLCHPSPLARDYVKNVCDKCNVNVTAAEFPLLFSSSSRYYDTVVFYAPIKEGFKKTDTANNRYFIPDNVYNKTLREFLDELGTEFAHKWRILDNKLYFIPKVQQYNSVPLFRFQSVDANLLIKPICGTWNAQPRPAYFDGIYQQDSIEMRGNTALSLYNDIVEWNAPPSPTQSGALKVFSPFAAARFRNDGITNDPITRLENNAILGGIVSILEFFAGYNIVTYQNDLVLSDDQTSKAKLLVLDPRTGIDSALIVKRPLIPDMPLLNYLQMDKAAISQTDTNYLIYLYNAQYLADEIINSGAYGGVAIPNVYDYYKEFNPRSAVGASYAQRTYEIEICFSLDAATKLGLFAPDDTKIDFTIEVYDNNGTAVLAEITAITLNIKTNTILITAER